TEATSSTGTRSTRRQMRARSSSFVTAPFHTRESPAVRLNAGGTGGGTPGARFSRGLQNARAEGARDQFDGQLRGLVLAVEDRVDLDDLERVYAGGLGDELPREARRVVRAK